MCGIAGVFGVNRDGDEIRDALDAMNEAQLHRGPDEAGLRVEAELGAGIACRRLSIVDLEHGQQPVANENGKVHCVLNGEIYNHNELRRTLADYGHRFRSRCDTEVIVHAYEQWGESFLERLEGMFALAVLDLREPRLLLARDGPGMKSLYYHDGPNGFLFASEAKALFATGWVSAQPSLDGIDTFLAVGLTPAPMTIFEGVARLRAGEYLVVGPNGGRRRGFFWRFHYRNGEPPRPDAEYVDEFDAALNNAVRSHLSADVPVGVLLSGGWDSSLVATYAAEYAGTKLQTFSIIFPDSRGADESRFSRLMAKRLGTDHHEIEFRPEKMVEDIPRMVRHLDEPFTSGPIYLNYLVASLASTQVKTVMGGEGADELLGGYEWMRLDWPYLLRPFVPHWFTEMLIPKIKSQRWRRALRIVGARTAVESDPEWRRSFCADEKRLLLKPEYRAGEPDVGPLVLARDIQETCGDSLQRRLAHDVTARLGEGLLFAEDKTTMAHSLELRLPFLDRSVIDLVLRLPSRLKVRKGREKIVLSHLARRHLPARIAQRRKKGLGFPDGTWRSGPVGEYGRQILMDSKNGPFDRGALERWMREQPRAGRIAGLIMLQAWWNEFVG